MMLTTCGAIHGVGIRTETTFIAENHLRMQNGGLPFHCPYDRQVIFSFPMRTKLESHLYLTSVPISMLFVEALPWAICGNTEQE